MKHVISIVRRRPQHLLSLPWLCLVGVPSALLLFHISLWKVPFKGKQLWDSGLSGMQ